MGKKTRAYQHLTMPDPDDVMSAEQVAYLFNVGPTAVEGWAYSGRLVPIPGSRRLFLASEVSRLYAEVGGSPDGHWRTWARTPRKGIRQAR